LVEHISVFDHSSLNIN